MGKLLWENLNILTSCFYSLKRRFFVLEYPKTNFPGLNSLKKQDGKIAIFWPKPWVNPFGKISIEKNGHISNFFFLGNIGQENVKTRSSKTQKIQIFPKGLTNDLVQKWPLFQLFFLGNQSRENVHYDILQRKYAFLGYKNKKFKKSKN